MRSSARRSALESNYWPALDGVRAIAISLVVAYHLGGLGGGWIGVDVFFVLSGFLITTLLTAERSRSGSINLRAFWARRAKRLLPAVLVLLGVLAAYSWAGGPGVVPAQLRGPGLATLFYVANWQQLATGHSYFASFSAPSPLQHTWSLAIEEQYYLIWPLLLGLALFGRRALHSRRALVATAALVVASAAWMGVVASWWGANRAYLGTDSRAWELLLGGVAALCLAPSRPSRHPLRWAGASVAGAGGVAVGVVLASGTPGWLWDGGLFAIALATCLVLVGTCSAPDGPVTRLLAWAPLRWLGRISYSLYLWHWPTIVLLNGETTALGGFALLATRLIAMVGAASVSYYVVERPLRRASWKAWWRRSVVPLAVAGTAAAVLGATVGPPPAASAPTTPPPAAAVTLPPTPRLAAGADGTPAHPWRIWILGDSVIADASPGITAALQSTGEATVVANTAFGGWGLTTDHAWPGDAEQIIAQEHPQVVIGTWSWDNTAAAADPAAYEARLRSALDVLLQPGDGVDLVVLMQFPPPGPPTRVIDPTQQRLAWAHQIDQQNAWDREARAVAAEFPGRALYLSTGSLFAPSGRFITWMRDPSGAWLRIRKVDNVHMCPYGAAEWGALTTQDLTSALGLGPMTGPWQLGPWTKDRRYNDPPGACPADQPPPGYSGIRIPSG